MKKILFLLITFFVLMSQVSFAALEDTVGHAAWTTMQNSSYAACFGVGNATNSFTDWLVVPDDADWASVQILDATSSTTFNYVYSAAVDSARFRGAISNATFSVEIAPTSIAAPTPAITTGDVPVYDVILNATGPTLAWNPTGYTAVPPISRKGLYRVPIRGEKVLRIKMDRSGLSVAYQWAIVRFSRRGASW